MDLAVTQQFYGCARCGPAGDYRFARRLDTGNVERRHAVAAVRRCERSGQLGGHCGRLSLRRCEPGRKLTPRSWCRFRDRKGRGYGLGFNGKPWRECCTTNKNATPHAAAITNKDTTIRLIDVAVIVVIRLERASGDYTAFPVKWVPATPKICVGAALGRGNERASFASPAARCP